MRATVTKYNQDRMLEVAQFHHDIGAVSSAFVPLNVFDSDGLPLNIDMLPDKEVYARGLKDIFRAGIWSIDKIFPFNEYASRLTPGYINTHSCGAPLGNTPVIATNGKIFSCIYLVNNPSYELGDIFENDFPRVSIINKMKQIIDVDNRDHCKTCGFRYLCGGGCPVGTFGLKDYPKCSDKIKKYVKAIECMTSKTVLTELFWYQAEFFSLKIPE